MKSDATNNAEAQAWAQYESIAAMVAALDCDYDRLEELRESAKENRAIVAAYAEKMDDWQANADAAAELEELAELEEQSNGMASEDEAQEAIQEHPLCIDVRSDWVTPGEDMEASEFRIVLCTGGPHVEIVGDLDHYKQPCSVRILYKDCGASGSIYGFDSSIVERYCAQFFFGE